MKNIYILFVFFILSTAVNSQTATLDSIWIRPFDAQNIQIETKLTASPPGMWYSYALARVTNDSIKLDLCIDLQTYYTYNDTINKRFTVPVVSGQTYTLVIKAHRYDSVNHVCLMDDNLVFDEFVINVSIPLTTEIAVDVSTLPMKNEIHADKSLELKQVQDYLLIKKKYFIKIHQIEILNPYGVKLKDINNIIKDKLFIGDLSGGLYLLRLYTDKGIITRKFQVKKE